MELADTGRSMRAPLEKDRGGDDRGRDEDDARARVPGHEDRDGEQRGRQGDAPNPGPGGTRQQEGGQVHVELDFL